MTSRKVHRYKAITGPHKHLLWAVVVLLQIVSLVPRDAWSGVGQGAENKVVRARVLLRHGIGLYQRGRYNAAIEAFEEVKRLDPGAPQLRYYLARAYVQQGDHYRAQGQTTRQRRRYKQALDTDPRLIENASFVKTYRTLQTKHAGQMKRRRPFKEHTFGFGLGLTLGVEGLLGIQLGGLFFGMINPLLTFSPVIQSLDFTLRIIPLRRYAWSPYIAGGVTVPFPIARTESPFQNEAPTIHATIGVHFVAPIGLTFVSGVSFTYNLTPGIDAPFLPMPSVQLAWYF